MAVTVADIRARKEFTGADAQAIERAIADADALVNSAAFGADADLAVELQACHLLAMSPFGERLRFKRPDARGCMSTYERTLYQLRRRIAPAGPVVVA